MDALHIAGGAAIEGNTVAGGSKNAALPIMAATLLLDGPSRLERVPRLLDVATQCRVLRELGAHVRHDSRGTLLVQVIDPTVSVAPMSLVRRMRASFCVLGPLLARRGRAVVALPGGCAIGRRPVDLHLRGLAALGADLRIRGGYVVAVARRLVGRSIDLTGPLGPTVTGTANLLCAATLARGRTTLFGAACEPEIVDLGRFLNRCGASIRGLGTPVVEVDGVERLAGCTHRVIPDRIESATLLIAAVITGGRLTIEHAEPAHLAGVLDVLAESGAQVRLAARSIMIQGPGRPQPVRVVALPYPGVPSDVQPQLTALAALAEGTSYIQDRVFPARFAHIKAFIRMGARIRRHGATLRIVGARCLHGKAVEATDLRASAALVLAGLAAEGKTTLGQLHHLDRGYHRLDEKLRCLGATIQRQPVARPTDVPGAVQTDKTLVLP